MDGRKDSQSPPKTYLLSLENRKARGSGHERPEEILCAARALFLEHGVENVTTRQIAARVGISQTALYVYFKSKEEMLDQLSYNAFKELDRALASIHEQTLASAEFLRLGFREYIRFGVEHPDEYRLMFIIRSARRNPGRCSGHPEHASIREIVFNRLQTRIEQGGESGELRVFSDPAATARSVWAAMHGMVALLLSYDQVDWRSVEPLVDLHVDVILNGLQKGAAGSPPGGVAAPETEAATA